MARIAAGSAPAAKPTGNPPLVVIAEHEQYGLSVGPDGGFKSPQFKHQKWGYVVGGVDENGDTALMEVVKYLEEGHPDFPGVLNGLDKFVEQYAKWKTERAKAA
jgi:hypothetical protein